MKRDALTKPCKLACNITNSDINGNNLYGDLLLQAYGKTIIQEQHAYFQRPDDIEHSLEMVSYTLSKRIQATHTCSATRSIFAPSSRTLTSLFDNSKTFSPGMASAEPPPWAVRFSVTIRVVYHAWGRSGGQQTSS